MAKPKEFKLPKLKKDQEEYLAKIKERERNPDRNIRFGPGPSGPHKGYTKGKQK